MKLIKHSEKLFVGSALCLIFALFCLCFLKNIIIFSKMYHSMIILNFIRFTINFIKFNQP